MPDATISAVGDPQMLPHVIANPKLPASVIRKTATGRAAATTRVRRKSRVANVTSHGTAGRRPVRLTQTGITA
jgi:hypothetical protein